VDQLSKQAGISVGRASRGRVERQQKPNNADGKCQDEATRFCKSRTDLDGSQNRQEAKKQTKKEKER